LRVKLAKLYIRREMQTMMSKTQGN